MARVVCDDDAPTFHAGGFLGVDHGIEPARFVCDVRLFREQLSRIPSITDRQARVLLARFRRAQRDAQVAAEPAQEADENPKPLALGLGVAGLVAWEGR